MKLNLFHIVRKSILYNKRGVLYLNLVIILLTAVITGSLMTGTSVRSSLKRTSLEKLGNAGIVISSSNRYFEPGLVARLSQKTGIACIGLLELTGFCTKLTTNQSALDVRIFGIGDDFMHFNGIENLKIGKGEAVVNEKLARYLDLKAGDDIVIRFNGISDLPADAPFAPERTNTGNVVLKISKIADQVRAGNFSLGISQIEPMNVFINRSDLLTSDGKIPKINRLIIDKESGSDESEIHKGLAEILKPDDIGLKIRYIPATKEYEIISERIFIDQVTIDEIRGIFPSGSPVITYLANRISNKGKTTPYSFIAALDTSLYPAIPDKNGIIINNWLANDLSAERGDTLTLTWYSPDPLNKLEEISGKFVVYEIKKIQDVWSDSLLMPEFPGISGRESCSDWDAGVNIDLNQIRRKDEDYWNKYRGIPKAFINYETGKKLWGSNFGPATAIRFPEGVTENEIRTKLTGRLDPYKSGFSITNLRAETLRAASKGVDFSTLFLGLGFFLILSALILLTLVTGTYYESKSNHLSAFFYLGFTNKWIRKYIYLETFLISLIGVSVGTFTGWLFNLLIIKALNSVWQGTVQTDTLNAAFDPGILTAGFIISEALIMVIIGLRSGSFLKSLNTLKSEKMQRPSIERSRNLLLIFSIITVSCLLCAIFFPSYSTSLSFAGGVFLFVSMVLITRHLYIGSGNKKLSDIRINQHISSRFYTYNSAQAVTPIVFIAAGLFAVIITGVNRMTISDSMLKPSGGTGGFLLWGETAVPVVYDLKGKEGIKEFGLKEDSLKDLDFVQALKYYGNDASCLNLNHITAPPLLGVDPSEFIARGSFSFSTKLKNQSVENSWDFLHQTAGDNTLYGIADQTVLQYGLKLKPGDTLKFRAETGQSINIIIAAGLKASVFQGFVLISRENFKKYFPSVSGNQIFLVNGKEELSEYYKNTLTDRLSSYGVYFEKASDRLASFFVVTNTYLSVFLILGGIGLILGVIGLGFVLLRNFTHRKREFGIMMATGFSLRDIRNMVFREHVRILISGVAIGFISAIISTLPSLKNNPEIPWMTILLMISLIIVTGFTALYVSLESIKSELLIAGIRKE